MAVPATQERSESKQAGPLPSADDAPKVTETTRDERDFDEPMDERLRQWLRTIMMIRHDTRSLFGLSFYDHCGSFLDGYLSAQVHRFSLWVDYPNGDRNFRVDPSADIINEYTCAIISSDGTFVLIGSQNGFIHELDLINCEKNSQWKAHDERITHLVFKRGILISSSMNTWIKIWNGYSHSCIRIINTEGSVDPSQRIQLLDVNDQATLMVISTVFSISLFSLENGHCLNEFGHIHDPIGSLQFISDSTTVMIGYNEHMSHSQQRVKLWHTFIDFSTPSNIVVKKRREHSSEITTFVRVFDATISSVCKMKMNCDHTKIAYVSLELVILSWPELLIEYSSVIVRKKKKKKPKMMIWHPHNPNVLVISDHHDYLHFYDFSQEGKKIGSYRINDCVCSLLFSPDGTRVIVTTKKGRVKMLDVRRLFQRK